MNTILNLTKKLISVPSVTGDLEACNDVLAVAKKELAGFTCEEFESHGVKSLLFFNTDKRPKKFKVILNGHLDVVAANPEQFAPRQAGDRLYGRGAYDMKGGGAVIILLFKELAKTLTYPIGLQLVTDEETGGFNGAKYQKDQGVKTDFILAAEPSDFRIVNKAKAPIWVKLHFTGKSAHGAYVWEGDNAVKKAVDAVNKLYKEFPTPTKEVWETTMNLSSIETSNKTQNKVPGDATVMLDIRFIPEDTRFNGGREAAASTLSQFTGAPVSQIEIMEYGLVQNSPESNGYIQKLKSAGETVSGNPINFYSTHGGSDVRYYSDSGSAACLLGARGYGMHTDNEWVSVESLNEVYNTLKTFLLSL